MVSTKVFAFEKFRGISSLNIQIVQPGLDAHIFVLHGCVAGGVQWQLHPYFNSFKLSPVLGLVWRKNGQGLVCGSVTLAWATTALQ